MVNMKTLTDDIFTFIVFFCNFDDMSKLLFINKKINNLVTPNYDKIKEDNKKQLNYVVFYDVIKYKQCILIYYLIYLHSNACNSGLCGFK